MYTLRIVDKDGVVSNFHLGDFYETREPTQEEQNDEESINYALVVTSHSQTTPRAVINKGYDAYIMCSDGKTLECLNRAMWHDEN